MSLHYIDLCFLTLIFYMTTYFLRFLSYSYTFSVVFKIDIFKSISWNIIYIIVEVVQILILFFGKLMLIRSNILLYTMNKKFKSRMQIRKGLICCKNRSLMIKTEKLFFVLSLIFQNLWLIHLLTDTQPLIYFCSDIFH